MEPENKTKDDCGCSDGNCCTPKKSTPWTKILFIVVIVAALAIIVMKFSCGSCKTEACTSQVKTDSAGGTDSTTKPCCADPNASCGDKSKK